MKTKFFLPLLLCLFIFVSYNAFANNISVTNVIMTEQNTTAGVNDPANYTMIQFDISWENSWRTLLSSTTPDNWDAAWVFVKYRIGSGAYQHAWLNNTGHINPSGSTINTGLLNPSSPFEPTTNPGVGAFIYRDANVIGPFSKTVKLRWNYGANGVPDDANVFLNVFAIEMVYVPQGPFYAGSGGSEYSAFYKYPTPANPYQISSEDAITVGNTVDYLYYDVGVWAGDGSGPIPLAFPKGFNAFYCMKYEIMQQQYVDFLNSLTQTQAANRKYNMTGTDYRYAITGSTVGSYATTNPYVACNYINGEDVKAYLDWSGLRPMTELEFEKSCRGTQTPVYQEYAWGGGNLTQNLGITNPGAYNETSTNNGNCTYGNPSPTGGPMRVGAFATSTSTRITSGATFYGIMEMSGNLRERTITVGHTDGRAFTGNHGNGMLDDAGNADVNLWPFLSFRGGEWQAGNLSFLKVSDRYYAAISVADATASYGGRGVRSAP